MTCKTTHHTGCECHEKRWQEKVDAYLLEIENLGKERKRMMDELDAQHLAHVAEVERLLSNSKALHTRLHETAMQREEARADAARMRAEIEQLKSDYWYRKAQGAENIQRENREIFKMLTNLEAENLKLRESDFIVKSIERTISDSDARKIDDASMAKMRRQFKALTPAARGEKV